MPAMMDDAYLLTIQELRAEIERLRSRGDSVAIEVGQLWARIARLEAALTRSVTAIDDWLNVYASEFCDKARVAEAKKRFGEKGTLAYIADVQQANRAALAGKELEPHAYMPSSAMYMGDCAVCGHLQGAPIHSPFKERSR